MIRMILTEEQGTDSAFNRFLVIYNLMKLMIMMLVIWWLSDADHDVITCCWSKQNLNKWTRGFVHHSPCVCCQRPWSCDHNIKHHNHHFHCIQCKQIPRLSFFGGQCCLFTNAVMSWPSSPDRKVGPRLTVTLANLKKDYCHQRLVHQKYITRS